jgi:hypothetical protein
MEATVKGLKQSRIGIVAMINFRESEFQCFAVSARRRHFVGTRHITNRLLICLRETNKRPHQTVELTTDEIGRSPTKSYRITTEKFAT